MNVDVDVEHSLEVAAEPLDANSNVIDVAKTFGLVPVEYIT